MNRLQKFLQKAGSGRGVKLTQDQTKDLRSWNPLIPIRSVNLRTLATPSPSSTHIAVGDGPVDLIVGADERVLSLQRIREGGHMESHNVGRLFHLSAVEQSVH